MRRVQCAMPRNPYPKNLKIIFAKLHSGTCHLAPRGLGVGGGDDAGRRARSARHVGYVDIITSRILNAKQRASFVEAGGTVVG